MSKITVHCLNLLIRDERKDQHVTMVYGVLTATRRRLIPSFVDFFVDYFAGIAVVSLKDKV